MGLKNSQYYAIMREYEKTQLRNHNLLASHYEDVYTALPDFKSLEDSISELSVQHGKQLLNGDNSAVDSLKKELALLRRRKKEMLAAGGFPEDYLEPIYKCPDCKDTGYIGNEKCHCFKQSVIALLYEQSNIRNFPKEVSFDHFCLDYYSPSKFDRITGRSSREMIEETLSVCHNFIDTFGRDFRNLFFYGSVGIGKTFLSMCIAREIMNREFSVLYFSAPKLFNTLSQNILDKKDIDARTSNEYIFNCDLLIIDDLGSEYTNAFIAAQFFNCINERLLHKKSTIISTNLSLESLSDLYTERAFSRITSSYTLLKIIGEDIRIRKKLEHRD